MQHKATKYVVDVMAQPQLCDVGRKDYAAIDLHNPSVSQMEMLHLERVETRV